MTKEEFEKKLDELLTEPFVPEIKKEALRLVESGAVDLENYEDEFGIVKTILAVALHNEADAYTPYMFPEYIRVFRNLRKF